MKITIRHLVVFTFAVFLSSTCIADTESQSFRTLKSKSIELDINNPDKPLFFIVWASWCPYCLSEIPELIRLHKQYPAVQFVGINVNKEPKDGLDVEIEKALPYVSISDPDLELSDQFKVRGTPGFILISKDGELVFKGRRVNKKLVEKLEQLNAS